MMTAFGERKLREIAAAHPEETFYCVCVYFDQTYADFILYLNVPEQAQATAEDLIARYPQLNRGLTLEEKVEKVKWNAGDFRYLFYAHEEEFWYAAWQPIRALYDRLGSQLYDRTEDVQSKRPKSAYDRFRRRAMEAACHVAIDLERGEPLKLLKKTADFRVTCVDHDEAREISDKCLTRARKTYIPLPTRGWQPGCDPDDFSS